MWYVCLWASVGVILATVVLWLLFNPAKPGKERKKGPLRSLFSHGFLRTLFGGAFLGLIVMFWPIHQSVMAGPGRTLFLSLFNAVQVFAAGCEYGVVEGGLASCPGELLVAYQTWITVTFALAPLLTFGFVLSFFSDLWAGMRYKTAFFKEVYAFSQMNERSLALACDLKEHHPRAAVVFGGVKAEEEEELWEEAKGMGAILFKKGLPEVAFGCHAKRKPVTFFAMNETETENLDLAMELIEGYRARENTNLYVFSTQTESELLLTAVDKGEMKVRRVNEVLSLVNRTLYERGKVIFESARKTGEGGKKISALVVGMGDHGTEMVKALAWFGQMDGYELEIHAFDKDPLAVEKFTALAPELMSPGYNGVALPGEAQYRITVHPGLDVATDSFRKAVSEITDATYAFISLGNDQLNIRTACNLRMYFERLGIHPVIQAVARDPKQKKALEGIRIYRGQSYDLEFLGDTESSFTESVILDSDLEEEALRRHLKWGKEEEFWTYEYNYRSSMASAIHLKARIACGIPGAGKPEEALTEEEKEGIERLEHRRWNAYMRAEGYIYSGSKDKASRNDLAKMHHDLVDYAELSEEEKRKDSKVGTIS